MVLGVIFYRRDRYRNGVASIGLIVRGAKPERIAKVYTGSFLALTPLLVHEPSNEVIKPSGKPFRSAKLEVYSSKGAANDKQNSKLGDGFNPIPRDGRWWLGGE